ncbi:MAG: hypothetical protein WCV00_22170 [Verrucomicrobiia bacterium]|jgi:hypothetical protein
MEVFEFLQGSIASLPKARPENVDFPDFLKSILDDFIHGSSNVEGDDTFSKSVRENVPFMRSLAESIVQIVKEYYAGNPHISFQQLSHLLNTNKAHFESFFTRPLEPDYLKSLYRLRIQDGGDFSRENMFHIPFELRHRVNTQRYSIPGFPSLYAGWSMYICWRELGCPPFDKVYSTRLEPTSPIRVLDFAYTPRFLASFIERHIKENPNDKKMHDKFLPMVLFWPLIAACSIQVLHRKDFFKPEYIIPQMVLQFVKEDPSIQGVRYFSMHYDQPEPYLRLGTNFVFPVKTSAPKGLCPTLRSLFRMTPVLPWQLGKETDDLPFRHGPPNERIELVKGYSCAYMNTVFGRLEMKTSGLVATPF